MPSQPAKGGPCQSIAISPEEDNRTEMPRECKKEVARRRKAPFQKEGRQAPSSVGTGLRKAEAVQEAQRCLGLRECESCEVCSLFCPDLCITRDEKTGQVLIDLDYCKGCGICASVCPKGAIQMVLEGEGK